MIENKASNYYELNSRTELEQIIAKDLKGAFNKRGFEVRHNGTETTNAPGKMPDIEMWDDKYHINVEVTQTVKSSADREYLPVKDHLETVKRNNPLKRCFAWYISPETHYRMANAIREYDFSNRDKEDMKIMPLSFSNLGLIIDKLTHTIKEEYTKDQIVDLFSEYLKFVDDERVLKVLYEELFHDDSSLKAEIETKEENKHQKTVEELISGLTKLEQDLRDYRIALSTDAIKNVILLVFIKLYEEKREFLYKEENRFAKASFLRFQAMIGQKRKKGAVHVLFENIKEDQELKDAKLFTESDKLSERLDDDFVIKYFLEPFSRYHFYTTKVDGLGAAYEVLGKLSGKDVKVGQFFTPENVVRFMVRLADLETTDVVLDPACGTARFLTNAMEVMTDKVSGVDIEDRIDKIKKTQLFGTDDDPNVAKLAKMNMYIHNDGKTNIQDKDGLLLYEFDGKMDVILTNPPLGYLNYMKDTYDDDFRIKRMELIPRKNLTEDKLRRYQSRLAKLQNKTPQNRSLLEKIAECQMLLSRGDVIYQTTGSRLKGGALFINAAKHYLKGIRDPNALPEWRGGKLLIVLDEGVLNTDDYRNVRSFIKKYFYIKAVISLTRDAFVPVSNTTTKTSILYAIKKDDPDATQREPIFFAHADKVGINTKKRVCPNHLLVILGKYREFQEKVISSYTGTHFNKAIFQTSGFTSGEIHD